ncbi:hypothetical protein CR513_58127, partial [Mucuna pruriens]
MDRTEAKHSSCKRPPNPLSGPRPSPSNSTPSKEGGREPSRQKSLYVRHFLDTMHIEKNICDSVIDMLLNVPRKSKDGINVRLGMVSIGIKGELGMIKNGKCTYLPPTTHTLSRKEKEVFCKFLTKVKVLEGYSSNIRSLIFMKDLKLKGLNSHACHVLMEHLLLVGIHSILSKKGEGDHHKTIDIIVWVSLYEMDVSIECYMNILKGYVKNFSQPKGCIVEQYKVEEVVEFCTEYLTNFDSIRLLRSRHTRRTIEKGIKGTLICFTQYNKVEPYVERHKELL